MGPSDGGHAACGQGGLTAPHQTYLPEPYDATNSSLLIETPGVLKAAVATSLSVQIKCVPLPGTTGSAPVVDTLHTHVCAGKENVCPKAIDVSVPQGAKGSPAKQVQAVRTSALTASEADGIMYTLQLSGMHT